MLTEYTNTSDSEREELARKYPKADIGHSICGDDNDGWHCTREKNHKPPHVAHGAIDEAYASWDDN